MFFVCFEVAPNSTRFEPAAIVFGLGLPISGERVKFLFKLKVKVWELVLA